MAVQIKQEAVAGLVASVVQRPREYTAIELAALLELDQGEGVLGQVAALRKVLEMYQMEVVPPLTAGEIDSPRLLRFKKSTKSISIEALISEVQSGECSFREFKSTLLFDVQRSIHDPGRPAETYRSSNVLFSCLKTICAFLNGGGGFLFVGVQDDGIACGLRYDFQIDECSTIDRWEACFRNNVRGRFHDGALVNDYVDVSFVNWDDAVVGYVQVAARKKLSLLRDEAGNFVAYRRQGNRSEPLPITEVEEFLKSKWGV